MNSFGIAWGRLGSDVITPVVISEIQATLGNVVAAINVIASCIDFDARRISEYSNRLPGLTRVQAVNETDQLIKQLQASCDNGAGLGALFIAWIHLGASQAIANTFVCRMIPPEWQANLRNHLSLVQSGITGFLPCTPGVNPGLVGTVNIGAANAYQPFSTIVGIHMQVLWAVSLTDCCCYCN